MTPTYSSLFCNCLTGEKAQSSTSASNRRSPAPEKQGSFQTRRKLNSSIEEQPLRVSKIMSVRAVLAAYYRFPVHAWLSHRTFKSFCCQKWRQKRKLQRESEPTENAYLLGFKQTRTEKLQLSILNPYKSTEDKQAY